MLALNPFNTATGYAHNQQKVLNTAPTRRYWVTIRNFPSGTPYHLLIMGI